MNMTICGHCRTCVMLMNDGSCPACGRQQSIEGEIQSSTSPVIVQPSGNKPVNKTCTEFCGHGPYHREQEVSLVAFECFHPAATLIEAMRTGNLKCCAVAILLSTFATQLFVRQSTAQDTGSSKISNAECERNFAVIGTRSASARHLSLKQSNACKIAASIAEARSSRDCWAILNDQNLELVNYTTQTTAILRLLRASAGSHYLIHERWGSNERLNIDDVKSVISDIEFLGLEESAKIMRRAIVASAAQNGRHDIVDELSKDILGAETPLLDEGAVDPLAFERLKPTILELLYKDVRRPGPDDTEQAKHVTLREVLHSIEQLYALENRKDLADFIDCVLRILYYVIVDDPITNDGAGACNEKINIADLVEIMRSSKRLQDGRNEMHQLFPPKEQ